MTTLSQRIWRAMKEDADAKDKVPFQRTLNLGCGKDGWGTDRVDLYATPTTTLVANIDKQRLPYKDGTFDLVKMSGVLEHLKNMGFALDEVYRVMKPGAELYIRTDNAGFLGFHLIKKLEHSYISERWYAIDNFGHHQEDDHHYHLFVPSHLKALLKKFKNIKIHYFYMNPNSWKGRLCQLLPQSIGASQIDVRCVK